MYVARVARNAVYLLFGVFLFHTVVPLLYFAPQEFSSAVDEKAPYKLITWKVRDHVGVGERITLSLQHRFGGERGALRYVVYQGIWENFRSPELVDASPLMTVPDDGGWSTWSFVAQHQVIFVGVSWEGSEMPIFLQYSNWPRMVNFVDYSFTSTDPAKPKELDFQREPRHTNMTIVREALTLPNFHTLWLISLAALMLLLVAIYRLGRIGEMDLVLALAGVVLAYRYWAYFYAPFWAWGGYMASFFSVGTRWSLLGVYTLAALFIPCVPSRFLQLKIPRWYFAVPLGCALVYAGWYFRCERPYHDWVYSITNPHHAPLSSVVYESLSKIYAFVPWLHDNQERLFSILLFIPFLIFVRADVKRLGGEFGGSLLGVLLFLSISSVQLYFAYVGVHGLPMLWWMVFLFCSLRVIKDGRGLFALSVTAFLAYLSHVSEALLVIPLAFVWIYALVAKRVAWWQALRICFFSALAALCIAVAVYYGIYQLKFDGDVSKFKDSFPFYGAEIFWGETQHDGLMLPFFSIIDLRRAFCPPGPAYAMFSLDNLIRSFNFIFHYSAFCFVLPCFFIAHNKGRDLKDPRIALLGVAFFVYAIYFFAAYVGWIPVIRDWDLFAMFSVLAASLFYVLCAKREMAQAILLVAVLNFLQTIPWLIINHYPFDLPW